MVARVKKLSTLSRSKIIEINQELIDFYYHPLGGEYIKGSVIGLMYEKHHGIFEHGFDDESWYKIHVAESPRGYYVITEKCENPNVLIEKPSKL